jgi:poly(3-hydroxybutyrate) depolymerase
MLAATHDPFISYAPGASPVYPQADYPGMEQTRDVWLAALGITGPAQVELLPDRVQNDSYAPHTRLASSQIELQRYPSGADGQELWFYKAVGMGHWWPNPKQMWTGLWPKFGKTNQDIDFADHAWQFFERHSQR